MRTVRPYKPAIPVEIACDTLRNETTRGWRDPDVVRPFIELVERGDLKLVVDLLEAAGYTMLHALGR